MLQLYYFYHNELAEAQMKNLILHEKEERFPNVAKAFNESEVVRELIEQIGTFDFINLLSWEKEVGDTIIFAPISQELLDKFNKEYENKFRRICNISKNPRNTNEKIMLTSLEKLGGLIFSEVYKEDNALKNKKIIELQDKCSIYLSNAHYPIPRVVNIKEYKSNIDSNPYETLRRLLECMWGVNITFRFCGEEGVMHLATQRLFPYIAKGLSNANSIAGHLFESFIVETRFTINQQTFVRCLVPLESFRDVFNKCDESEKPWYYHIRESSSYAKITLYHMQFIEEIQLNIEAENKKEGKFSKLVKESRNQEERER